MIISELIDVLKRVKDSYGDLEITIYNEYFDESEPIVGVKYKRQDSNEPYDSVMLVSDTCDVDYS